VVGMTNFYYNNWALYTKEVTLKNNQNSRKIYFFSKNPPKDGAISVTVDEFKELNFDVKVNERTGLPFVKRKV